VKAEAAPVPSPCNNVCKMDERSGWCLGCYRTLDEIATWSSLEEWRKRAVVAALAARREAASAQRVARREG
jgi:predicted Fe-S protein YdhL (DUF1289 family)